QTVGLGDMKKPLARPTLSPRRGGRRPGGRPHEACAACCCSPTSARSDVKASPARRRALLSDLGCAGSPTSVGPPKYGIPRSHCELEYRQEWLRMQSFLRYTLA